MDQDQTTTVIPLAFGAPLVFRACPEGDPSPLHSTTMAAIKPITDFNGEWVKVAADRDLSPEGKAKKLTAALNNAREAIERQQRAVADRVVEFERDTREFYKAPEIESTDAVGALLDRERRDWLSQLDHDGRAAVLSQMQAGEHRELLVALVRSPVPIEWSDLVGRLWRDAVEKQHPTRAANRARRRESIEWANAALSGFASRLPDDREMLRKLSSPTAAPPARAA